MGAGAAKLMVVVHWCVIRYYDGTEKGAMHLRVAKRPGSYCPERRSFNVAFCFESVVLQGEPHHAPKLELRDSQMTSLGCWRPGDLEQGPQEVCCFRVWSLEFRI